LARKTIAETIPSTKYGFRARAGDIAPADRDPTNSRNGDRPLAMELPGCVGYDADALSGLMRCRG
jgi:hypothetical protein